jgi:hypothetical protein
VSLANGRREGASFDPNMRFSAKQFHDLGVALGAYALILSADQVK